MLCLFSVRSLKVRFDLGRYRTRLAVNTAIGSMIFDGGQTNTAAGLIAADTVIFQPSGGDRPGIKDVLILISDGRTTRDEAILDTTARNLRNRGVNIYGDSVIHVTGFLCFKLAFENCIPGIHVYICVTGNSNKGLMSMYMPFIQLGSDYGIVKYQKPSSWDAQKSLHNFISVIDILTHTHVHRH